MKPDRVVKFVFRIALPVVLAGAGLSPALAQESGMATPAAERPVIADLIQRILGDPTVNFDSVADPSDCKNETLYLGTRDVLGKYAANPAQNRTVLQGYLISGRAQCDCAEAIIGKEFDIVLHDLGPETARYRSCYDIHHHRK